MKVSDLFEKHKLVRRLALLWAVLLITWATVQMFEDVSKISSAAVSAYAIVAGLLTTMIGLYQHHRSKEDRNDRMGGS